MARSYRRRTPLDIDAIRDALRGEAIVTKYQIPGKWSGEYFYSPTCHNCEGGSSSGAACAPVAYSTDFAIGARPRRAVSLAVRRAAQDCYSSVNRERNSSKSCATVSTGSPSWSRYTTAGSWAFVR